MSSISTHNSTNFSNFQSNFDSRNDSRMGSNHLGSTTPTGGPNQKNKVGEATRLADYISQLYGDSTIGWNEQLFKGIAETGKFYSEKLGKEVTVPQHIQYAAKSILDGGINLAELDLDKDSYVTANELRVYAGKAPGSTDIR